MSRALNIDATVEQVIAASARHAMAISTIEPLVPCGTRVVFLRSEDAEAVQRLFGERVIRSRVARQPIRPRCATW